jgi:transcriptional regulator with XRE-family HTH domain
MAARPRKEVDTSSYVGRFAERLKTLRERAGMTVDELAAAIGIAQTTIYYWESGEFTPNVEQIEILADALQTKPRLLLPDK